MSPIDKTAFDHLLDTARQVLGEDPSSISWADGSSLNIEQALIVILDYGL